MKKKFKNWILHIIWGYSKTSKQIATLEAKRYKDYLVENYTEIEQITILKDLKVCIIQHRELQIKKSIEESERQHNLSLLLTMNLNKITQAL